MRKIEQQLSAALQSGRPFHGGNSAVMIDEDGARRLVLHGSTVAKIDAGGMLYVDLCGWDTPTTRSRINVALLMVGGRCYRDRGVTHMQGSPGVGPFPMDSAGFHAAGIVR